MKKLKQIKQFFFVLLSGLLFYSCSDDELTTSRAEIEQGENFVSLQEATSIASQIEYTFSSGDLSLGAKTLKTTSKVVRDITEIPDENDQTSYYIINYENEGFLIMAADKRVSPVLAFSDSNNFPLDIEQYPSGLVEWLVGTKDVIKEVRKNNLKQTIQMEKEWNPKKISSSFNSNSDVSLSAKTTEKPSYCDDLVLLDDEDPEDYPECFDEEVCENTITIVGPLLSTSWGQGVGYNNLAPDKGCDNYSNGRTPTGCVATSMAQIINYYEYPNDYNYSIMLDNISFSDRNSSGAGEISKLMSDVGSAVRMDYGCNASSADTEGEAASSFRNNFNYSSASYKEYANSDHLLVKSQIKQGKPVILRGGRDSGWWIFGVYDDGHAWVCDGYKSWFVCDVGTKTYFNMNWGWNGNLNGYYLFNNWNPGDNSFNYKRGIVYNITP